MIDKIILLAEVVLACAVVGIVLTALAHSIPNP